MPPPGLGESPGNARSDLNILHFGRFYPRNFGGLERHVGTLLDCLKQRMQVTNIVANETCESEVVHKDGYDIYKMASLGVVAGTALCPTMPCRARKLCASVGCDIAHLHFPDPMSHLAYHFLPAGTKLVISWHSDIIRQKRLLSLYQPFLNHIVARADAIIAATPKHFSSSTQMGACRDSGKKFVVPYGIDFQGLEETASTLEGAGNLRRKYAGKKIIFALGRHVYYKGFDYLIRAMQAVTDDAVLVLGGSGPKTAELKGLVANLSLAGRVFFLGRIPEDELPHYYHACDLFCLPSIEQSEAFGIVQVEAMACGKPVVCCELNNGVTYVNQAGVTGLAVPPRDPQALAGALNDLLADKRKRLAYGQAANARVHREFTLSNAAEGTVAVYRAVLGQV